MGLSARDKKQLEELERDVKAVLKARETLGDKAPTFGGRQHGERRDERRADGHDRVRGADDDDEDGGRESQGLNGNSTLGKRRRDERFENQRAAAGDSDDSTPESVKNIPMPRDTPPPILAEFLPPRNHHQQPGRSQDRGNPNLEPLGEHPTSRQHHHPLPPKPQPPSSPPPPPPIQIQTVYEAKPIIRDLRKEATRSFVPNVVRQKIEAAKGQGKLLEPDEMERLEQGGYGGRINDKLDGADGAGETAGAETGSGTREGMTGRRPDTHIVSPVTEHIQDFDEEERRFQSELQRVTVEDVDDGD